MIAAATTPAAASRTSAAGSSDSRKTSANGAPVERGEHPGDDTDLDAGTAQVARDVD